ncbi:hypothetical protein SDC9_181338 [bioreactor metagenome]|uniref:Uncharacterized protein n=1 Tax=bioreactor metagenome TaxID=1076179 RepID=A0A645H5T3_9ZZZZ
MQAEATSDTGDCRDDRIGRGAIQVADKAAVDLERADRKLLQIGQGRIAGTKIVDGHRQPRIAHGPHLGGDPGRVLHHHALGDLELKLGRGKTMAFDALGDHLHHILAAEVVRRQVERHAQVGEAGIPPLSKLPAGTLQHPMADVADHADFLGHRYEGCRADLAVGRVVPAQQRLHADNTLALQADLGLIVQLEFAALERKPEVILEGDALAIMGV